MIDSAECLLILGKPVTTYIRFSFTVAPLTLYPRGHNTITGRHKQTVDAKPWRGIFGTPVAACFFCVVL